MFHAADEGTMLLDEVGELSPSAQAAMLRVLERGEVTRVGSTRAEPVNVRVLAATNRDLEDAVARGGFRRDLLFRLDRFSILVPPLRDRPDDLAALVRRTLGERAISEPAKKALATYGWPGNVRELQNVLERAIVLAGQGPVDVDHLPRRLVAPTGSSGSLRIRLEGTEAEAIKDALEATGGNRTHAARRLGISRRALLYKMQKLKLR
jgi:transcriptional regulator with PAS, ATPase and Fis domain